MKKTGLMSFVAGTLVGAGIGILVHDKIIKLESRKREATEEPSEGAPAEENLAGAPEACPGINSEYAGKADACDGCPNRSICSSSDAAASAAKTDAVVLEIRQKLAPIKHKILILSGKGGVGKSTVSAQLAWTLQARGMRVGLLDIDICGPSIPKLTGTLGRDVHVSSQGWQPIFVTDRLAVMSVGFLLPNEDDAIVWRGPKKNGLIRQFLMDVLWGDLDILLVDTPPGTSDEHLSAVSFLKEAEVDGAIVVTTPQEVSLQDVRKEITFCKQVGLPVLGVVENMTDSIFSPTTGGAIKMCEHMGVPLVGQIPLDRELLMSCEDGSSVLVNAPHSDSARSFGVLADLLQAKLQTEEAPPRLAKTDTLFSCEAAPASSNQDEDSRSAGFSSPHEASGPAALWMSVVAGEEELQETATTNSDM